MFFGHKIALEKLIIAKDLLSRWGLKPHSLDNIVAKSGYNDDINTVIKSGLPFLLYIETRINKDGEKEHFFSPPMAFCASYSPDKKKHYRITKADPDFLQRIFFYLKDVEECEKRYPHLCLPLGPSLITDNPSYPLLEAELATCRNTPKTKTSAATEARQGKILEQWRAVFPAMCEVYHQCLTEGPKGRTRAELKKLFSQRGANLSDAQLDFFRTLLPDEYVNKTGGAPVQGAPS